VSARRRLGRLVRTGSPRVVARAVRRELLSRRHEAEVARAAREGRRLLVGPFLGEVGFELLYWIPLVRRLLAEHGVDRGRVTVLARGGSASWYRDFADEALDVLDLVPPDMFLEELVARRRRGGTTKQFFEDAFDAKLVRLAVERIGPAAVVHPLLMYSRMRFLWEGLLPPEQAPRLADYRPLEWEERPLPAGCPAEFAAVKFYFSDPFPDGDVSRGLAARVLEDLAERLDVVALTSGRQLDEHREWLPSGPRVHDAAAWVQPQDNLAIQTNLVARSRALVCTYGGFSYLGPMLGVPTLALQVEEPDPYSSVHLAVVRAAFPTATYSVVGPDDLTSPASLSERLAVLTS